MEVTLDDIERTLRLGEEVEGNKKKDQSLPSHLWLSSEKTGGLRTEKLLKDSGLVLMENLTKKRFNLFKGSKKLLA